MADGDLFSMYQRYPPVGRFLRNLVYGAPPDIPSPPSIPPGAVPPPGLPGPQPTSLHDYPTFAARPLSPNLEDLRFQTPERPAFDWRTLLGGAPPPHMLPLVAKGLQVLGGGGGGGLPPGPGPAPSGTPFPTPPTPYGGTSILSQRLDPQTVMLSNQPPTEPQPMPAPPPPPPTEYPTPAAETYATQQPGPMLRQVTPDWTRPDARRAYRGLDTFLQQNPNPDPSSALDTLPLLHHLMDQGYLTVSPDDFDTVLRLPRAARERLIPLIDSMRPFLLPPSQTVEFGPPEPEGAPMTEDEIMRRYGVAPPPSSIPTP